MHQHEYLGARRLLAGPKAAELWHLACIRTSILARDAFLWARRQWSCCIWCVCARVSGREGRGIVAFGMYLHEWLGARRRLASARGGCGVVAFGMYPHEYLGARRLLVGALMTRIVVMMLVDQTPLVPVQSHAHTSLAARALLIKHVRRDNMLVRCFCSSAQFGLHVSRP